MKRGNLGKEIKEKREKMGFTQKQIAKKVGWSSSQALSNVERGVEHCSFVRLEKLCQALKMNYKNSVLKQVSEQTGLRLC